MRNKKVFPPSNRQKMKGIKTMKRLLSALLVASLILSLSSCVSTYSLKEPIIIPNADKIEIDITPDITQNARTPEEAITDIAVDTIKSLYKGDRNVLVSPVSVSIALGLTAGGAKGDTYSQFEKVLGRGISMAEMNGFYQRLTEKLEDSENAEIDVANSVWVRDDDGAIRVDEDFIEYADDVFDADVFTKPFDDSTVKDINHWVDDNTDGMIKEIIDKISVDTVMYLINALAFDAKWQREYTETSDYFKFTNCAGDTETVTGMYSTEALYLEDENTTGFIKNYKGGEYAFAVFLPDSEISINEYVSELTGEKLINMLSAPQTVTVEAKLPKFSYEYSANLNDTLKAMGLTDAFDSSAADLSGLGTSDKGNLYVSEVIHKTFIEVAEDGTRAAAVTSVAVNTESAAVPPANVKYVTVNRPFVFAIIDTQTNLPLFLGTVLSVEA